MVQCKGKCGTWHHFTCVGMTRHVAEKLPTWSCNRCMARDQRVASERISKRQAFFEQQKELLRQKEEERQKRYEEEMMKLRERWAVLEQQKELLRQKAELRRKKKGTVEAGPREKEGTAAPKRGTAKTEQGVNGSR